MHYHCAIMERQPGNSWKLLARFDFHIIQLQLFRRNLGGKDFLLYCIQEHFYDRKEFVGKILVKWTSRVVRQARLA